MLLESGAAKDKQNRCGSTALIYAAGNDSMEMVQLLVEAGADRRVRNRYNATAFTIALAQGITDIELYLLYAA